MARPAAIAAQCAGEQGKFWEFHQQLFRREGQIDELLLQSAASSTQLDVAQWKQCKAGPTAKVVAEHHADARSLSLKGTPVFLIGRAGGAESFTATSALYGIRPIEEFEKAIVDAEQTNKR